MTWQTWRWTEERVELLKKLWGEGLSASQIAARFNNAVTREAVLGKVHRTNMPPRGDKQGENRIMRKSRKRPITPWRHLQVFGFIDKNAPKAVAKDGYVPPADEPAPLHQRKTVVTLEDDSCRWPIGDAVYDKANFHFCGAEKVPGLPYCRPHCDRAFVSVPKRVVREIEHMPMEETEDA